MGDRTSTVVAGPFTLHTDKDHLGYYRGYQAMDEQYRGWHYHVDSEVLSPVEIILLFEVELLHLGARYVELDPQYLFIGSLDRNPPFYRTWTLNEKTVVLWVGNFGKLHVEANKTKVYAKCIFKKPDLGNLLKEWAARLERKECVFFQPELETCSKRDCGFCKYSEREECLIKETKAKMETELSQTLTIHVPNQSELMRVE